MSFITGKPFVDSVLGSLKPTELKRLQTLINNSSAVPIGSYRLYAIRSSAGTSLSTLLNVTEEFRYVNLSYDWIIKDYHTGILVKLTNNYGFLSWSPKTKIMSAVSLTNDGKYNVLSEQLTTEEFRRVLADMLVEAGEGLNVGVEDIDATGVTAGKAIVSDGTGGALWHPVTIKYNITGAATDIETEKGAAFNEFMGSLKAGDVIYSADEGRSYTVNILSDSSVSLDSYDDGDMISVIYQYYNATHTYAYLKTETKAITVVEANVALEGGEADLLNLSINATKYKVPPLSLDDGISFGFSDNSNYTVSGNFSSYNRCGKEITFVVACFITKTATTSTPISLGSFFNIPDSVFDGLFPATLGTDAGLLDERNLGAFNAAFTSVNVPANIAKNTGANSVTVNIDPTNLVENTQYYLRYAVTFLLTDDLSGNYSQLSGVSWAMIKNISEAGLASNYWAVGDTKTDTGVDGYSRTFRIVDMSGLYDKHVVFEQVNLEGTTGDGLTGVVWNRAENTDSDNCYNDYNISDMRITVLPGVLLKYSSALQAVITNTTYQVATNGNNGILLNLTDKLFLEAEKEVWTSRSYSRTEEFSALTTFNYYTTHTSASDHIKKDSGNSVRNWWLRSPYSGFANRVCRVGNSGDASSNNATNADRFAPCFSL